MTMPLLSEEAPQEVIVTANRREENAQDVALTIQTLNGEQLSQLRVTTFSDLLQYAPNVTFSGNGPGTGNIAIRGLGFGSTGNQSQSTTAPFTNVALYLDEQPMQFPSRNNDVYMADMQRVEILEGPQGTLFGGGAQAGAIVYVTNKPALDATTANISAGYGITAGGGNNSQLSATLNLPLIEETLAARFVVFSERQGGYIDNVPSTIGFLPGSAPASTGVTASNSNLVANETNPITYEGARVSLLWKLSDEWNLLLQQNYQQTQEDGYFYAYPQDSSGNQLQPYQITAFTPAFNKDRYESTSWTLKGAMGPVSAVYTGSFMTRQIEGQQDYSNYLRAGEGSYYACIGTGSGYFNAGNFPGRPPGGLQGVKLKCGPPVAYWNDTVRGEHQSHELRLSSDPDQRLRALLGAFWEKQVIFDDMQWYYLGIQQCGAAGSAILTSALNGGEPCVSAVGPAPGSYANQPGLRENSAFGEDAQRGYRQLAFFGSVDFDLIPKVLTVTAGTRHYDYQEFEAGSVWYTESTSPLILNHPNGACTNAGDCGIPFDLNRDEGGFVSRGNLSWHIVPDVMLYYTYSQGFRPASFNRTYVPVGGSPIAFSRGPYCGAASQDPRCRPGGSLFGLNTNQYLTPVSYQSDTLINNEVGLKSEWLDHRLMLNASFYRMKWNNVQWQVGDNADLGYLGFIANGPSFTIQGAELQLSARVLEGFLLQAAGSWNNSRQTNAPCLVSAGVTASSPNNPTPAGQCVTTIRGLPYTNPWGGLGSELPFSPQLQFNVRARYEWAAGGFRPFAMIGASHIGAMQNEPNNFIDGDAPSEKPVTTSIARYTIPGNTTYDGSLGVSRDNWTAQITGSNLTDVYGPANITSAQFIKAYIPLRPRVLVFSVRYRF
jgi:outer membrane receptor protein involved in Fe transport